MPIIHSSRAGDARIKLSGNGHDLDENPPQPAMRALQYLFEDISIFGRCHACNAGIERADRVAEFRRRAIENRGVDLLLDAAGSDEEKVKLIAMLRQPIELGTDGRYMPEKAGCVQKRNWPGRNRSRSKQSKPATESRRITSTQRYRIALHPGFFHSVEMCAVFADRSTGLSGRDAATPTEAVTKNMVTDDTNNSGWNKDFRHVRTATGVIEYGAGKQ